MCPDTARFQMGTERYSLESMQAANAESAEVAEWLPLARVGETRMFGGGAAAVVLVSRVA